MLTKDLHLLPKMRDRWSYLYLEHAKVDREDKAIAIHDTMGITPVPCAGLALLMLGPGISITHAAILTLADCGCLVAWVGEAGVRFYASGSGTTRSAANLLRQARFWADNGQHLAVIRRMYGLRFRETLDLSLTLEQIRGKEGARVRGNYAQLAADYNVQFTARNYDRSSWHTADPINRALSVANSCLYGVCHAAIVAAGYSPALGFIHTGKQLSFVYDVADLYKTETSFPAAFKAAAEGIDSIDRRTRIACRDEFQASGLLKRVVSDLHKLFELPDADEQLTDDWDEDPAQPGALWNPSGEHDPGGVAYGLEQENKDQMQ